MFRRSDGRIRWGRAVTAAVTVVLASIGLSILAGVKDFSTRLYASVMEHPRIVSRIEKCEANDAMLATKMARLEGLLERNIQLEERRLAREGG